MHFALPLCFVRQRVKRKNFKKQKRLLIRDRATYNSNLPIHTLKQKIQKKTSYGFQLLKRPQILCHSKLRFETI